MDLEYWSNRLHSGINYDTMIGWDADTIRDETEKLFNHMKTSFPELKYEKVLDYGCGLGRFATHFDCDYVGTDILSEVVETNRIAMPNKKFERIYEYTKEQASGLIFLSTVFQYFTDEEASIELQSEFDGAKDIVIIESLKGENDIIRAHEHNRKPEQLIELAEKNGWKVKGQSYFNSRERYFFLWLTK